MEAGADRKKVMLGDLLVADSVLSITDESEGEREEKKGTHFGEKVGNYLDMRSSASLLTDASGGYSREFCQSRIIMHVSVVSSQLKGA